MKNLLTLLAIPIILLFGSAVSADEARDYIDNEVAEWNRIAVDTNGYTVLQTYVEQIALEVPVVYTLDLGPGKYRLYASGGLNMTDLDMTAVDEATGDEIDSDTQSDKIPIMKFTLEERQTVVVTLAAFAFAEGFTEDWFCLLVTTDGDGECFSTEGVPVPIEEAKGVKSYGRDENEDDEYSQEVEDWLDDWLDYTEEAGFDVQAHDSIWIDRESYENQLELDSGYYTAYAYVDSRFDPEDLYIRVYDGNGDLLSESTYDETYGTECGFYLEDSQWVTIELYVDSFGRNDEAYLGFLLIFDGDVEEDENFDEYYNETEVWLDDWLSFAEENDTEVGGYGSVWMDSESYEEQLELESGFYWIYGYIDSRYAPDDLSITVHNGDGDLVGESDPDAAEDYGPYCSFILDDDQWVTVEFRVDGMNRDDEAYVSYVMTRSADVDDDSRREYIEEHLDNLRSYVDDDGGTLIASDYQLLTEDEDVYAFDYELEEGEFVLNATGGLLMNDLALYIYDENNDVICQDEIYDIYPVCVFELDEAQTVHIEFIAFEFRDGYDEEYFAWSLSSTDDDYEGPVG